MKLQQPNRHTTVWNFDSMRVLLWAQWLIVAAMFVAAALAWPSTPDQVPIHWNLSGQVDRYAGKVEGLLLLPIIGVGIALLLHFGQRYFKSELPYVAASVGFQIVLAGVYALVLLWAHGIQTNVALVVAPLVGALLILIGAVLGQVRRNWFFGIRTPWTMSSERSWAATHQAGRWVFIAMGLCIALAGLVQSGWAITLAILVCIGGVLGLVAYSYLVWRSDLQPHT